MFVEVCIEVCQSGIKSSKRKYDQPCKLAITVRNMSAAALLVCKLVNNITERKKRLVDESALFASLFLRCCSFGSSKIDEVELGYANLNLAGLWFGATVWS